MIIKKIHSEIYSSNFVFIISKSRDKVFEKFGIEWNEAGGACEFHDKIYIIYNPDQPLSTLVHECDHAIGLLWKSLQIKKLKGIDECYSYMLSWIFEQCYKTLKKNKKCQEKRKN